MTYEKQTWNKYDDLKTEEENIQNGAVVTDNRMNHMEDGISSIDLEITSHESNQTNPHSVTKEQVGLSNVSNYGIATEAEATAGTSNAKYMTPSLTKKAAKSYVDKTDVGLSNVDNVKQASKSEFDEHTANKNNPHSVTATQVGAYTKSESDATFALKSDIVDAYSKTEVDDKFALKTSLNTKANDSEVIHITGDQEIEGSLTVDGLINKKDIDWTTLGTGSKYKKSGSRVTIAFDYTPATNANFNMGTLPEGFRPTSSLMFVVAAFSSSATLNSHVQINEAGTTTILAPTANQAYRFQIDFDI